MYDSHSRKAVNLVSSIFVAVLSFVMLASPASGQLSSYEDFAGDTGSHSGFRSDSVVRLLAATDSSTVRAGSELPMAFVFDVAPTWHIWPTKRTQASVEGLKTFEGTVFTTLKKLEVSGEVIEFNEDFLTWPEHHTFIDQLGDEYACFDERTVVWLPAVVKENAPPGEYTVKVEFEVQSCNDKFCKPAATVYASTKIQVVDQNTEESKADTGGLFDDFPPKLYSDLSSGAIAPDIVSFDVFGYSWKIDAAGAGLYLLLCIAALGGFLLNLTPCVLPVIPLKIMGLSQSAEGSRGKTVMLGLALGAGVISFWLGLGFLIASVSSFTASNQLFQYPLFTITVGVFIAIMAIGMCGLFSIELPSSITQFNPGHDTLFGSFLFGVMTAILSTPCTAPFMGAAAGWAASKEPSITMLVFATIGFGMALPYIVLSAYPKLISKMPRTGPASELIKQVMGLMMLGAALYFIGVGISGLIVEPPNPPSKLYWWAVAAPLALAGLWMAFKTFKITPKIGRRAFFGLFGLLIAAGSIYGAMRFTDKGPINWTYYTHERFDDALANGQVVVLEYTAEWCLNCKALEEAVLRQKNVFERIEQDDVQPIKIDLTKGYADANERLVMSGRRTIPLLQIFAPDGKEVFKSDAYTSQQVLDAIRNAKN